MSLNKALMDWNGEDKPICEDLADDGVRWGYGKAIQDVVRLLENKSVDLELRQEIARMDDYYEEDKVLLKALDANFGLIDEKE